VSRCTSEYFIAQASGRHGAALSQKYIKFAGYDAETDSLGNFVARLQGTLNVRRGLNDERFLETETNRMEADRRVWQVLLQLSNPRAAAGGANDPCLSAAQWQQLFDLARVHGVLGILLHNLGSPCAANHNAWRTAERLWYAKLAKSLLLRHYGPELVDGLTAAGIPAATFKGADFADHLYPRPALRAMFDIDVLIPRERWSEAGAALEKLGYARDVVPTMRFAASEYGEESWRLRSNPAIECDLHWNLINHPSQRRRASIEFADLDWEAAGESGTMASFATASRATPASRLVIAAAHAAITHQFDRLLLLCDLREACRHFTSEVELAKLRLLVDRTGMRAAIDVALSVTARVLNDPGAADLRNRLGTRTFTRFGAGLASEGLLLDRQSRASRVRLRLLRELLKRAA